MGAAVGGAEPVAGSAEPGGQRGASASRPGRRAFAAAKKPANMSDARLDQGEESGQLALRSNALAWEATAKKDTATAENEYKASLDRLIPTKGRCRRYTPSFWSTTRRFRKDLFEYARAAQYDRPGRIASGGDDATTAGLLQQGLHSIFTAARTASRSDAGRRRKRSALPPDGMQISERKRTMANKEADAIDRNASTSDPAFKIWYAIKQHLTGDQGDAVLHQQCEGH